MPPEDSEETTSQHQYYLVSVHDTILYADMDSKHLRHAPFGTAPLNLVLELAGPRGRLLINGNSPSEIRQVSFTQSSSEIHTQKGRADFDCHIENFPDDVHRHSLSRILHGGGSRWRSAQ